MSKIYEVVWIDSGFSGGWRPGDAEPEPLPKIRSYGIISHRSDKMLEISSSHSENGDLLNPLGIPLGAVLEINELKEI